jgi:hypothetical protein
MLQAEGQENSILKKINKTGQSSDERTEIASKVFKNGFLLLKDCSLGVGFGLTQFYGDISEDKDFKHAFTANIIMPLQNHYIQAELIKGGVSAKNPSSSFYNSRHTIQAVPVGLLKKGERFDMQFIELDINFLISLSRLLDRINLQKNSIAKESKDQRLDLFCKLGFGINLFRSLRQEITTGQFINSYGYKWMWENDFQNAGTQNSDYVKQGVFVLGMVASFKMTEQYDINFSVTSRISETDKWDAKLSGKNDMFMFYSFGTIFRLGAN